MKLILIVLVLFGCGKKNIPDTYNNYMYPNGGTSGEIPYPHTMSFVLKEHGSFYFKYKSVCRMCHVNASLAPNRTVDGMCQKCHTGVVGNDTIPAPVPPVPPVDTASSTCNSMPIPPSTNGNTGEPVGVHPSGWVTGTPASNHHMNSVLNNGIDLCFNCHQAGINTINMSTQDIKNNATFCIGCHSTPLVDCIGGTSTTTPPMQTTPIPVINYHSNGWVNGDPTSNHHKKYLKKNSAQECIGCHNTTGEDMSGLSDKEIRKTADFCITCH